MATVKTAISIEETLIDRVNDLAEELQIPRSQVFVLAIEKLVRQHENCDILDTLNAVYDGAPDPGEEALQEGMRRHQRQLVEGRFESPPGPGASRP